MCYVLIDAMPEPALDEAFDCLNEVWSAYVNWMPVAEMHTVTPSTRRIKVRMREKTTRPDFFASEQ
jgi:hypothetical protein